MTNTIPNVPRELLERVLEAMIADWMQIDSEWGPAAGGIEAEIRDGLLPEIAQLRALLSAPSTAGVDGLEVVAWRIGFPHNSGYKVYEQRQPWAYEQYGVTSVIVYEVQELCRLSAAQAIIDGLRGENEALHAQVKVLQSDANSWQSGYDEGRRMGGKHCALTIDQQAQRIGELEGLLRGSRKHVAYAADHCEQAGMELDSIDAALSAVCAAAPNIAPTSEHGGS